MKNELPWKNFAESNVHYVNLFFFLSILPVLSYRFEKNTRTPPNHHFLFSSVSVMYSVSDWKKNTPHHIVLCCMVDHLILKSNNFYKIVIWLVDLFRQIKATWLVDLFRQMKRYDLLICSDNLSDIIHWFVQAKKVIWLVDLFRWGVHEDWPDRGGWALVQGSPEGQGWPHPSPPDHGQAPS